MDETNQKNRKKKKLPILLKKLNTLKKQVNEEQFLIGWRNLKVKAGKQGLPREIPGS